MPFAGIAAYARRQRATQPFAPRLPPGLLPAGAVVLTPARDVAAEAADAKAPPAAFELQELQQMQKKVESKTEASASADAKSSAAGEAEDDGAAAGTAEGFCPADGEQWRVNFSRVQHTFELVSAAKAADASTSDGSGASASEEPQQQQRYRRRVPHVPEDNWVWSPQGAVAMHMPERWGFVQFSAQPPPAAPRSPRDCVRRFDFKETDSSSGSSSGSSGSGSAGGIEVKGDGKPSNAASTAADPSPRFAGDVTLAAREIAMTAYHQMKVA